MINRKPYKSDAALALPADALNTEYIVVSYTPLLFNGSEFLVVAPYDNTKLTITPSVNIQGHNAAIPFSVNLMIGQGYFNTGLSATLAGDVTGIIIQSNKPVFVVNGEKCSNIPPTTLYCDHIFEVSHPVQKWGKIIPVKNLPKRPLGNVYRILASENGTIVKMNGFQIATLNRGEYHETFVISGELLFEADKPIFVVQYMTGDEYPNADIGDPAMGNMILSDQYLRSYNFSSVGGGQFVRNYVTIIADYSDINSNSMLLDGSPLAAGIFSPDPGTTLGAATITISNGTHTTNSPNPHRINVQGYNDYDSYIYPSGAAFKFINPVGDENPPICSMDLFGEYGTGIAKDDRPTEDENNNQVLDDGEDLNVNDKIDVDKGIFLVELDPSGTNVLLTVDSFVPGDPMVSYTVTLIDNSMVGTGIVIVTYGAGNTCSSEFTLSANELPVADAGDDATNECNSFEGTLFTLDGSGSTDPDEDELSYT